MQRAKKIVEGYDRKHLDGGQEVESRDIGARTGESPMQYAWCMHAGSFHSGLHTSSCATIYRGMCNIKSTLTLTLLFLIYAVPYCVMRFIVELNVHVYTPPLSPPTAVHTRRQYKRAVEVLRVLA